MMDDTHPFLPAAAVPQPEHLDAPATDDAAPPAASGSSAAAPGISPTPPGLSPAPATLSPAVVKFKSCRWRADPEAGEFCTHRDVLPFAGKAAFHADSWCPECAFYKLRRTPKKRERADYTY